MTPLAAQNDPSRSDSDAARRSDPATMVQHIASIARDRGDFLTQLAAAVAEMLDASVVALSDASWAQPCMLVRDESLAAKLDRSGVRDALAGASASVRSEIIPLVDATSSPSGHRGQLVELCPMPARASMLILPRLSGGDAARSAPIVLGHMRALQATVDAARQTRHLAPAAASHDPNRSRRATAALATSMDSLAVVRSQLRSFHLDLDPTATAYRIASELPRLLPCDRATLLLFAGGSRRRPRYRVAAISGTAVIDRRSPLVKSIASLAADVAVMHQPWIHPTSEVPPQMESSLETYLDESGVGSMVAIPLTDPRHQTDAAGLMDTEAMDDAPRVATRTGTPPMGMMLLESFSGNGMANVSPAMTEIANEASLAIANARRHDGVFALPIRRPLAGLSRSMFRHWVAAIALTAGILSVLATVIEVDHAVMATGVARPIQRRAVFAVTDGTVDQIHVHDGDRVRQGDPLITFENADVIRESETIAGQLDTATQKLASLRAMRGSNQADQYAVAKNVLEQRSLQTEIATLQRRAEINRTRQDQLIVRSPIDGIVVGWRLSQRLADRPVARGDRLCGVIDPSSDWELDLRVEERFAGEIFQRHHRADPLPVEFIIASDPTQTHTGHIESIADVARRRADGTSVIDLAARIDTDVQWPAAATNASASDARGQDSRSQVFRGDEDVTARVLCGRRRWIQSVTDDVVGWFHRHILFHFR